MKKLVALCILLLVSAVSFWLGRWTAPAPTFQAAEGTGDDPLADSWDDFVRAQQETLALFRGHTFYGDGQERAEAYRGLLYSLVGSIKTGVLMDPDFPRFMRAVDWTGKSGLDNPDNNYHVALIRDDAEYRITGTRGTTSNLVFQLVVGQPGVRGAGSSTNVSVLYGADMILAEDGGFEILVSRENPGPGKNWLRIDDGAETILVRHTHSDWTVERAGDLIIERLGAEGHSASILDAATMAAGLRNAAEILFDRNATWLNFANKVWTLMPRNGVSGARPSEGGLVGQFSAFGTWELEDDQAIILSTAPTSADYQGVELGNLWFVSLDYETRTSSLTANQAYLGEDGRYHFVIAARDPGIQNWLDTEGHRRGLIMLRWQGLDRPLTEEQQPRARLVEFDRLSKELPPDIPAFDPQQREEQIRHRRRAVQTRFGG